MNIAVAQSGGPTCAINSSLAGVVKQALSEEKIDKVKIKSTFIFLS